jgi:hypothetical protein
MNQVDDANAYAMMVKEGTGPADAAEEAPDLDEVTF